jgi:uncharacterized membrane protein
MTTVLLAAVVACDAGPRTAPEGRAAPAGEAGRLDPGIAPPAPPAAVRHWQCAETGVASRVDDAGRTRLFLSGRTVILAPNPPPVGGAAVEHGAHLRFAQDGNTAMLTLPGGAPVDCVAAQRPSPWFDAAVRGVALRGLGSEPGWLVEVRDEAGQTVLHAELDYGESVLDALPVSPGAVDGAPWTAETAAGEAVSLTATGEACSDGMSGERFEARIHLQVGDREYVGCGATLDDFEGFAR